MSVVPCGQGKFRLSNQCFDYPEFCAEVDGFGACKKCTSDIYVLSSGECRLPVVCPQGSYANDAGECVLGNPNCALMNPTDGTCVSCQSGARPNEGHCCPAQQTYHSGSCVDSSTLLDLFQSASGPACLLLHFTNYCLRCPPGFKPNYITPKVCVPK